MKTIANPTKTDAENPPLDDAFFLNKRPAAEVLADWFGEAAAEKFLDETRRARGQRGKQKAPVKQQVAIRLDTDVLKALRATGRGWQSRVNGVLRREFVGEPAAAATGWPVPASTRPLGQLNDDTP